METSGRARGLADGGWAELGWEAESSIHAGGTTNLSHLTTVHHTAFFCLFVCLAVRDKRSTVSGCPEVLCLT